jgi:hypothetical protein
MLTVVGLFNTLFVISFINWIRGRGEWQTISQSSQLYLEVEVYF